MDISIIFFKFFTFKRICPQSNIISFILIQSSASTSSSLTTKLLRSWQQTRRTYVYKVYVIVFLYLSKDLILHPILYASLCSNDVRGILSSHPKPYFMGCLWTFDVVQSPKAKVHMERLYRSANPPPQMVSSHSIEKMVAKGGTAMYMTSYFIEVSEPKEDLPQDLQQLL